jgi:molybdopterin-binding protein
LTKSRTPRTTPESALYRVSEAARLLSISSPTLKHWIQQGRLRAVRTPGGHYRVPLSEVRRLSGVRAADPLPDAEALAAISGRNKLYGTVTKVRFGGLLAEVTIAIGEQSLTAIITSASCRALGLKTGVTAYGLIKATEVMVIRA